MTPTTGHHTCHVPVQPAPRAGAPSSSVDPSSESGSSRSLASLFSTSVLGAAAASSSLSNASGNMSARSTKTQKSSPFAFLLLHSLTTTLSVFCRSPSTVRDKGFSCCDTGLSGSGGPATKARSTPGIACQGSCDNSMPPLPAPNLAGKKRCCHPIHTTSDVQRIVAHNAFPGAIRRHTFVFLPSSAITFPHWTILAAHLPFVPYAKRGAHTS